ncbi:hypothetical protein C2G38_2242070 [Gigaspora rosea]|uniref:B30.2/SPRY domain-containing protein n=1 Tax=Gigaspora rosea TaxID=44941 RepID=A0A397VRD7_9GLOM|nr:hypothetical protein C2G38_2242070 [Gigaspora rosea]
MESTSHFVEIDGSRVNFSGPNDYREVALAKAKDKILSQNEFFYFEVEIVTKGNKDDRIIGVGFCTTKPKNSNTISNHMPGQDNNSWGYHDDGYFFSSKNGRPYGPSYTTGDTIGCYLNFKNRIVFYTKNGVNIGIACHLPEDLPKCLENSKTHLYPCVGLRSQGGSIEVNFGIGGRKFKYSAMNNDDIDDELYGENCLEVLYNSGLIYFLDYEPNNVLALMYRGKAHLIMKMYKEALEDLTKVLENDQNNFLALTYRGKAYFIMGEYEKAFADLTKVLENDQNNLLALTYRGKAYFIIGEYEKAFADLTKVLENEPENIIARRYRGEINQMMERYYESSDDLKELLKINPNDVWAINAHELVEKT